jgi:riboflavin-specific deaminase-like protein
LKRAQTRDGAIAKRDGSALKITSQEQDVWSHTFLRGSSDAILVGVETVILDGPQLTPRLANTRFVQEVPKPYRVILDPHTRLPLSARVVSDAECNRTIVVTAETKEITQELTRRGVSVVTVPLEGDQFSWEGLFSVLTTPSGNFPGIATLLVEGGARTWQAFQEAGYVDEEVILVGS